MIVKIEDVGFNNKGAALMLYAIVKELKKQYEGQSITIVVSNYLGDFEQFASLNLYREAHFYKYGVNFLNFIPDVQLVNARLINPDKIDVIINASGFSIGDFWSKFITNKSQSRLKQYKKIKQRGGKVIFMPQAFGPFKDENVKKYVQDLNKVVDVFFAREKQSYEYLTEVIGSEKVKLCPDFTNLYTPEYEYNLSDKYVVLIPNSKMLESKSSGKEAYFNLFVELTKVIQQAGLKVVFLNHEGPKDFEIIEEIISLGGIKDAELLNDLNADQVKGVIKNAFVVVSSRFHGAVSSLSQNVPLLVTSWSHKYEELLKDYNFSDGVISSDDITKSKIRLQELIEKNGEIREKLTQNVKLQKELSSKMWQDIYKLLTK